MTAAVFSTISATEIWAVPMAVQLGYDPVLTQPANNGDATLAAWAAAAINSYNADFNSGPDLPALPAWGFNANQGGAAAAGFSFDRGAKNPSFFLPANSYVILNWGGSNIDNGTLSTLFYIPTTDEYTFTASSNAKGGLSSIHVYGAPPTGPDVPDSGSSLTLVGVALLSLEALRRRLKR
jgi:hypothetical protein